MQLWIDADPLIYKAAYAAEYFIYHVGQQDFKYKAEADAYRKEHSIVDQATKTPVLEPVETALFALKNSLNKILQECLGQFPIEEYAVVLSGRTNYRTKIYPDYKKGRVKPKYYNQLRQYMVDKGAVFQEPLEADDLIAIKHMEIYRQDPLKSVISSIDKDLYILPGHHYDYGRKVYKFYSPEQSRLWFFRQLLHGDRTDGIAGIYRLGPAKAKAIIEKLNLEGCTEEQMLAEIVTLWKEYKPLTYKYELVQNFKLLDIGGCYKQQLKVLKQLLE